jgi:hypothetical protein
MAEQKRVAYFDYVIQDGDPIEDLTPNKKYMVLKEGEESFTIQDDRDHSIFCLKGSNNCYHLDLLATWILEDLQ